MWARPPRGWRGALPRAATPGCWRAAYATMYHYSVLGVPRTCTREEAQTAFRQLAKEYHPDSQSGRKNEARMKLITNAYNTILEAMEDGSHFAVPHPHRTRVNHHHHHHHHHSNPHTAGAPHPTPDEAASERLREFFRLRHARRRQQEEQAATATTTRKANPKQKAWWWMKQFERADFTTEEFLQWAAEQPEFREWAERVFESEEAMAVCFDNVHAQYFGAKEGYKDSNWGENLVHDVFSRGKTVHERGMLQYVQYLSDAEIIKRIRGQEGDDPDPPRS
eukprot:EG_transcript_14273